MMISKENLRMVSFKIEPELFQALEIYALNHKMTRSEAIRLAIKLLINSEQKLS